MTTIRKQFLFTLGVALWAAVLAFTPHTALASQHSEQGDTIEPTQAEQIEIIRNTKAPKSQEDAKLGRNMEILVDAFRSLQIFYVDPIDSDKMLKDALYGMTIRLDPYTAYLSEEDLGDFEVMTTGKYGGIGSLIRQKDGWIYIAQPYKDSPADRAGLEIGDKIIEINGVSAQGVSSSGVSSQLKGDPGSVVSITVEKFYDGEHKMVEIERERIAIPSIPYYGFISDSIGYINHSDFTQSSSEDMRDAVMRLKSSGKLKGLVLDYRENSGGILQEAVKILSLFVPKGTEVVEMRGKSEMINRVFETETDPIDLTTPIVVLIGGNSASAAEIVAGALQDLDRAVLVGQRSFGKGLVQSTRPLGYNSLLKITTAKYYLPSDRCIQAIDYSASESEQDDQEEGEGDDAKKETIVREFSTKGGRKVYDGGGVMPDIKLEPEYVSRFTVAVYMKGYMDDFSGMYARKYRGIETDPETFTLSDRDYDWFIEFMADKELEYQSETATALKTLKKMAEKELYMESIGGDIERMELSLRDDKDSNLRLYRAQISSIIENDIMLRDHYQSGMRRQGLNSDTTAERAIELLNTPNEYHTIITTQDTTK